MSEAVSTNPLVEVEMAKRTRMHGVTYWVVLALGALGLFLAVNQTFTLRTFGFSPLGNSFLYYLIGIFLSAAYLIYPMKKSDSDRTRWYYWVFAVLAMTCTLYLGANGLLIIEQGWDYSSPLKQPCSRVFCWFYSLKACVDAAGPRSWWW